MPGGWQCYLYRQITWKLPQCSRQINGAYYSWDMASGSVSPFPHSLVISWPSQQMSLTWGREKGNLIYFSIFNRACQLCRQKAMERSKKANTLGTLTLSLPSTPNRVGFTYAPRTYMYSVSIMCETFFLMKSSENAAKECILYNNVIFSFQQRPLKEK